jgi:hypothetical protein
MPLTICGRTIEFGYRVKCRDCDYDILRSTLSHGTSDAIFHTTWHPHTMEIRRRPFPYWRYLIIARAGELFKEFHA